MQYIGESNIFLSQLFSKDEQTGKITSGLKALRKIKDTKNRKNLKRNIQNLSRFNRGSSQDAQNYTEYLIMDATYPIIKAALDIYSEEATCQNFDGRVITINSTNKKIKEELEDLFYKVLKLDYTS